MNPEIPYKYAVRVPHRHVNRFFAKSDGSEPLIRIQREFKHCQEANLKEIAHVKECQANNAPLLDRNKKIQAEFRDVMVKHGCCEAQIKDFNRATHYEFVTEEDFQPEIDKFTTCMAQNETKYKQVLANLPDLLKMQARIDELEARLAVTG
tara:strand:+ start:4513 stop:4965 length:453 start_codon:yes stop_codon:yes gene_type:complete